MSDNFLTIARELKSADLNRYRKNKLTNRLADYTIEYGDHVILQHVEAMIDSLMRSNFRRNNINGEYIKYTTDYHSYTDVKNRIRGVILVSIIIDYRGEYGGFEENIFKEIVTHLKTNNLDQFINDVNVNDYQWRRDRKVSKLYK